MEFPKNDEVLEKIEDFAKTHEKQSRFEHSKRVAQTCVELCKKYGQDEYLGYFAGISHDICKDFPENEIYELALKDGEKITPLENEKKALLHGRAASVVLTTEFGVKDEQILQAVRVHTFGCENMCDLAKILFIADKIEPGRPHVNAEYMQKISAFSLDELAYFVLQENIDYLKSKGLEVAPETFNVLSWLERKVRDD